MEHPTTPDGRYFVVRGRLWRCANPALPAVDAAKRGLGERGPVWWTDGAPDYNLRLAPIARRRITLSPLAAVTRPTRVLTVTLGLSIAGAAAGAAAVFLANAVVTLAILGLRGAHLVARPAVLAVLLPRGALLGALLGPLVAWGLLRRVPLGWVVTGIGGGALGGALAGNWLVSRLFWGVNTAGWFPWFWGALVGILVASLLLSWRFRPRRAERAPELETDDAPLLTGAPGPVPPARAAAAPSGAVGALPPRSSPQKSRTLT